MQSLEEKTAASLTGGGTGGPDRSVTARALDCVVAMPRQGRPTPDVTNCLALEIPSQEAIPHLSISRGATLSVDFARLGNLTVTGTITNCGNLEIWLPQPHLLNFV